MCVSGQQLWGLLLRMRPLETQFRTSGCVCVCVCVCVCMCVMICCLRGGLDLEEAGTLGLSDDPSPY